MKTSSQLAEETDVAGWAQLLISEAGPTILTSWRCLTLAPAENNSRYFSSSGASHGSRWKPMNISQKHPCATVLTARALDVSVKRSIRGKFHLSLQETEAFREKARLLFVNSGVLTSPSTHCIFTPAFPSLPSHILSSRQLASPWQWYAVTLREGPPHQQRGEKKKKGKRNGLAFRWTALALAAI